MNIKPPDRNPTPQEIADFEDHICWKWLVANIGAQAIACSSIRDQDDCSRDRERLMLGKMSTCSMVLNFPAHMKDAGIQLSEKDFVDG